MYATAKGIVVTSFIMLTTLVSGQENHHFRVVSEEAEQTIEMVKFAVCFEGSPQGALPEPKDAGVQVTAGKGLVRLMQKSITKGCSGENSYELNIWLEGTHFLGRGVYSLTIRNIVADRVTYPIGRDKEVGPWYTIVSKPP